jgi:hypothetical protein
MWRVIKVSVLPGYRLEVEFADGVHGVVDLSGDLWGPMFEPLKDPDRFAEVGLDEDGVICWPNGADLAPDALYDDLKAAGSLTR